LKVKNVKNALLREEYFACTHESGLKIIYVPKNSPATCAMLCVNFGAFDVRYVKDGKRYSLPPGTAHFLEHKMFEKADGGDAFLEFGANGADANACTLPSQTCYYFSCSENLYKNLSVLLRAVSEAHFTKASIDRERAIIRNEINMYSDDPSDEAYHTLMRLLYRSHPLRNKTGGSVTDAARIGKNTLLRAFGDFYLPSNMALAVCGSADIEKIYKEVDRVFGGAAPGERPETLFPREPARAVAKFASAPGAVAAPLYSFGIKCPPRAKTDLEAARRDFAMNIALSLAFGGTSEFCRRNYASAVNDRFCAEYNYCEHGAHMIFSGSGGDPERVAELIIRELEHRVEAGFDERDFMRDKRAAYAESILQFDSCAGVASAFARDAFDGCDRFDLIAALREVTFEDVQHAFDGMNFRSASALSVITPEKQSANKTEAKK